MTMEPVVEHKETELFCLLEYNPASENMECILHAAPYSEIKSKIYSIQSDIALEEEELGHESDSSIWNLETVLLKNCPDMQKPEGSQERDGDGENREIKVYG